LFDFPRRKSKVAMHQEIIEAADRTNVFLAQLEAAQTELLETDKEYVPVDLDPMKKAIQALVKTTQRRIAAKPKAVAKKHPRVLYGTPQKLSTGMAAFMGLDVPIASVKICVYFIQAYRFLSSRIFGIDEPSRLVAMFKDHPLILQLTCEFALGYQLQEHGFITKEVVRSEWDDAKFSQLEDLLDNCRVAMKDEERIVEALAHSWLDLGLTPFDLPGSP
jgi:hypothetical protein